MTLKKPMRDSWIAGLWEHRLALGIAATASVLMMALLVLQPTIESRSKNQRAHQSTPVVSKSVQIVPPSSGTPRYTIPDKTLPDQQVKKAAPPAIKTITPDTPTKPVVSKPAAIKQAVIKQTTPKPAHKPVVKAPAAAKPVVKPIAKPKVQTASGQVAKQDAKTEPGIYFVQVGAFRERSSAQQQAATLLQKGWNSMVTINAAGWFAVRVGPISSRNAADKLQQQLLQKAKLKGFIVKG